MKTERKTPNEPHDVARWKCPHCPKENSQAVAPGRMRMIGPKNCPEDFAQFFLGLSPVTCEGCGAQYVFSMVSGAPRGVRIEAKDVDQAPASEPTPDDDGAFSVDDL